ncbi:GTP-binding protein [Phormidium sp. CCY1219]|uniref:GTP-binding protein n=1 Tax=Phormidium sp. CCY1219 TaxID=2886104 RepID=UPI002D1F63FF|nr:GTP-binding protein [Phormidium sp. CCY1219]MEB3828697.1 GTP-binding protein [Phormidium sp. CCY1219]
MGTASPRQDPQINSARASIRQALSWYSHIRRNRRGEMDVKQQAQIQAQLDRLSATLEKLDRHVLRIAAFGLVSRGKSAVLNALMGEKILTTGPTHGITQWPRSVQWNVADNLPVELIDTPGLDEVEGQARSEMARNVAQAADLILFVVSGDITRTEYDALCELRRTQKPLILVFNKVDLYPEQDRRAIYRQLQYFASAKQKRTVPEWEDDWREAEAKAPVDRLPHQEDIVMVSAEPAPLQVRVEWPDGQVSYEWETPPAQIDELKQKILQVVNQQGRSLLAINALVQAREAQEALANCSIEAREEQAEQLIWRFAQYKALVVALNPIAVVDLMGGAIADLLLIRALARLYGLPMTGYEAGKLWQQILFSSSGLLLSELANGLFMGFGKSAAAIVGATGDVGGITGYAGAAIAQASMAGFGTYKVGQAAQVYLAQGCTWGPLGANTVIQDILSRVEPNTVLYRLRQELQQQLEFQSNESSNF